MVVHQLQRWGVPIVVSDELPNAGFAFLRQKIDAEISKAVQKAMDQVRQGWGVSNVAVDEVMDTAREQTGMPSDPAQAPTGTLHETLDAFGEYIKDTAKKDAHGNIKPDTRKSTGAYGLVQGTPRGFSVMGT